MDNISEKQVSYYKIIDSLKLVQLSVSTELSVYNVKLEEAKDLLDKKNRVSLIKYRSQLQLSKIKNNNLKHILKQVDVENDRFLKNLDRVTNRMKEVEKLTCFGFFLFSIGLFFWVYHQNIQTQILKRQRDLIELKYQNKIKGIDKTKYRKV